MGRLVGALEGDIVLIVEGSFDGSVVRMIVDILDGVDVEIRYGVAVEFMFLTLEDETEGVLVGLNVTMCVGSEVISTDGLDDTEFDGLEEIVIVGSGEMLGTVDGGVLGELVTFCSHRLVELFPT